VWCYNKRIVSLALRTFKFSFKNILMELQSKKFDRPCVKNQSSVMCISHSWRDIKHYLDLQKLLVSLFPTLFLDFAIASPLMFTSMCCGVKPNKLIDMHIQQISLVLSQQWWRIYPLMWCLSLQCCELCHKTMYIYIAVSKPTWQIFQGYSHTNTMLVYVST
jgi:hypothetical protein